VARQVYGEYGIPGFWNGTAASLIMVANPTIQYALYEWLQAARAKLRWAGAGSGSGQRVGQGSVHSMAWQGWQGQRAQHGMAWQGWQGQRAQHGMAWQRQRAWQQVCAVRVAAKTADSHAPHPCPPLPLPLASRRGASSSSGGRPATPARATALEVFLLSALAKTGATLITYPLMNIKTRMYVARKQQGGSGAGGGGASSQHSSILQAAAEILRSEGGRVEV